MGNFSNLEILENCGKYKSITMSEEDLRILKNKNHSQKFDLEEKKTLEQ